MFWENENYKYLEILDANTIIKAKMKEKVERSTANEQENFSKPSTSAQISLKA